MPRIKICGVYAIIHSDSGKAYVGSSSSIRDRWYFHRSLLRRGQHHSQYLQRSWSKYGEAAFSFVELERCGVDELFEVEARHMARLDSANPAKGFNVQLKPGSALGYKHSAEARARMSASHRAIPHEERLKFCRSFVGRKHTPETKERMAEAARKRWANNSSLKEKMSARFKGVPRSQADREKMREGCAKRRSSRVR